MNLAEMKRTIERGKALGLIHAPGQRKTVQLPSNQASAIGDIRVAFTQITPAMARDWLVNNTGNRRMRESTVNAYERDMRNNDWLLNHQGIAFDKSGTLIDGQHRLEALARSGKTITFLVSTGWPKKQESARNTTMDTVDRGLNRTIADQLGLQHGLLDARYAVSYASVIAKLCRGNQSSIRMSTALTMEVISQFANGTKFAVEQRNNLVGLRSCAVLGAIAFAFEVHPKEASAFYESLVSGIGLTKGNPILSVRNWLTVGEGQNYITGSHHFYTACVVLNHIERFCANKLAEQLCTSQTGFEYFAQKNHPKVEIIKALLQ